MLTALGRQAGNWGLFYLPVVAVEAEVMAEEAAAAAVAVVVEMVASAVVDLHLQIFRNLLLPCIAHER